MRKLFAIGTLLLSSAAVMVMPAAASDRNSYANNQNYNHGYSAPASDYSVYTDRGRFNREEQERLDWRMRRERLERLERERREHARRYWNDFHWFREGY